jgi:hypothetical protein
VAASKLDLLPWFENNASEAAFSVDSSRRYTGPAPLALVCPEAGGGEFACSEGTLPPHGTRRYLFAERVEAGPHVNRAFYVDAIEQAEREGRLSPSDASRLRRDLAAVGDDFFAGLSLLTGIRTVGTGENRVPPPGVPLWIACRADGAMFSCHDLAHSRDVPVGTPLYLLKESSDWRTQPRPLTAPVDVAALFHAVLGRQLRPAEARFLFDLATIGSGGAESHAGPVRTQPIP